MQSDAEEEVLLSRCDLESIESEMNLLCERRLREFCECSVDVPGSLKWRVFVSLTPIRHVAFRNPSARWSSLAYQHSPVVRPFSDSSRLDSSLTRF